MVPRRHLKALAAGYAMDLQSGSETLSPDKSWYEHAKRARQRVYALDPLLVYHPGGYSNTWNTMRGIIPTNDTSIGGGRGWRTMTRKRRRKKQKKLNRAIQATDTTKPKPRRQHQVPEDVPYRTWKARKNALKNQRHSAKKHE